MVGGNAVGWTALTPEGFVPERVERVSLPLDAPSVLRTVLFTRGMYLGPIPADPISQQLVLAMGRPQPLVAFVCPIEVRDRPVAILYADSSGRAASDKRVAELVAFAQLLGRRLERLILENKRKLTGTVTAAPAPPAAIEPVQESSEVVVEPPPPAAAPLPEILPAEDPVRVEVPPLAEPVKVEEEPTQVAELPVEEPVKVTIEGEPTQVAELPVEEPIRVEQEPTQVVEIPMEEPVKAEREPTLVAEMPVEVPLEVVAPPAEKRPAPVPAKVAKAPRRRAPAAPQPPDKYEYIPAPAVPPPPVLASFVIDSPGPTAAEIFARSPARPKRSSGSATSGPALPTMEPMLAPGVSRMAVPSMAAPPSPQELHLAADKLIGTDLAARVRALGVLMRAPDVAAAVLATRFPGPLLRARVPLTELPAAEELGPVPAALARMGPAAARALLPLIENRDADCRYFALLTAGCAPSPAVIGAIAEKVFDKQPLVANAARVALAAQRGVAGFADAVTRVRHGLSVKDAETAICAAKALGPLHDLLAVDKLIELTGSEERPVAQAASDALREITKQTLGTNPTRWTAWWEQNQERPRAAWLVEALRHRELDIRLSAIDELVRAVNDNFGYYADGPKAERDQAVGRWIDWLCNEGSKAPIE